MSRRDRRKIDELERDILEREHPRKRFPCRARKRPTPAGCEKARGPGADGRGPSASKWGRVNADFALAIGYLRAQACQRGFHRACKRGRVEGANRRVGRKLGSKTWLAREDVIVGVVLSGTASPDRSGVRREFLSARCTGPLLHRLIPQASRAQNARAGRHGPMPHSAAFNPLHSEPRGRPNASDAEQLLGVIGRAWGQSCERQRVLLILLCRTSR
jgi:hypothetical protein